MNRVRPYIPLSVRVQVAERQLRDSGKLVWIAYLKTVETAVSPPWSLSEKLQMLLFHLFSPNDFQLDHDPALILRKFNPRTGKPYALGPQCRKAKAETQKLLMRERRRAGLAE